MTETDDLGKAVQNLTHLLDLDGGGGGVAAPSVEAKTKTAEALPQGSEAARKNRRLSASLLTEGFAPPKLGIPGLDAFKGSANLG